MDYSKKIIMIRAVLGLSQNEIGKRVGLTGAHVSRLEKGKTRVSDSVLRKYIDVFDVDPAWMYSNDVASPKFIGKSIDHSITAIDRIKGLRVSMGMSQNQFAEYTGVKHSDINLIEAGKLNPGPLSLKRIAEACHVGVDWLQYGDENRKMYPVDDRLIEYLWKHENMREMIYHYMDEDSGKE